MAIQFCHRAARTNILSLQIKSPKYQRYSGRNHNSAVPPKLVKTHLLHTNICLCCNGQIPSTPTVVRAALKSPFTVRALRFCTNQPFSVSRIDSYFSFSLVYKNFSTKTLCCQPTFKIFIGRASGATAHGCCRWRQAHCLGGQIAGVKDPYLLLCRRLLPPVKLLRQYPKG